jgi:hypothetical protein
MRSIEELTEELLALPSASRALLAEKLVESLEFDIDPTIQAAWVAEAKKRREQVRDGDVQPVSGDEALAQVRRLLGQWSTLFTLKLLQNMLKLFNIMQSNGLRSRRHSLMLWKMQSIALGNLLLDTLLSMRMFGDVWPAGFPMKFSTQLSRTAFLFWQWCIAAESLDIGKTDR